MQTSSLKTIHLTASQFEWAIAPSRTIPAWGFNGTVPGPVIEARQGDTLHIRFTNLLAAPSIVHWHGLRIPAAMDGTEAVQSLVQPGETYDYLLPLPDAGTFWYHAHANETVQMERGMYGSIVVRGAEDPSVDHDRVLMFDDMSLDARGAFRKPSWFLPRWLERHNGREGRELLINGKKDVQINMPTGRKERWRIINAASARYIRFCLDGTPFQVIAMDGRTLENPASLSEMLLTPGERIDILVGPFESEMVRGVQSLPYDRGVGRPKKEIFGTLHVHGPNIPPVTPVLAEVATQISVPELAPMDAPTTRRIILHGHRNWKDGVDFTINGQQHLEDEAVQVGSLQIWEIHNPGMMDHPFHLHGFFFQVLSVNGTPPLLRGWKDTVNVPRHSVVRIAWVVDDRPGRWMYHCHILEHHAAGMMAHFDVIPADGILPEPDSAHTGARCLKTVHVGA
jgi:FtsP/CotA-like multicopper oxidase with cupredoxin domain